MGVIQLKFVYIILQWTESPMMVRSNGEGCWRLYYIGLYIGQYIGQYIGLYIGDYIIYYTAVDREDDDG